MWQKRLWEGPHTSSCHGQREQIAISPLITHPSSPPSSPVSCSKVETPSVESLRKRVASFNCVSWQDEPPSSAKRSRSGDLASGLTGATYTRALLGSHKSVDNPDATMTDSKWGGKGVDRR